MKRWQALFDAQPRHARVHIFRTLRRCGFDLVRRARVRGLQFRAMHFRLPLQVRILVHLVGPHGRIQLEPTRDGNDFLAVWHAMRSNNPWHSDAFSLAHVTVAQFGPATRTVVARPFRGAALPIRRHGFISRRNALRSEGLSYSFLPALRANVDIFAERNFERFKNAFFVEAEALAIGNVAHVRAEFAVGPEEIADRCQQLLDVIILLDELRYITGGTRGGYILQRLR